MQQVEADVIRLEPSKLLVEKAVAILLFLNVPKWQLGGQVNLLPIAIREGLAHRYLAVATVVGISSINVIHPLVDGIANHLHGLRFVNIAFLPLGRKPHCPEAEGGHLCVCFS